MSVLESRAMSGFPVSIGTGLALETLFEPVQEVADDGREVDKLTDLSRYETYLINIETLVRNILSTVSGEDLLRLKDKEVYTVLIEEMEYISWLFKENGLYLEFYINTYSFYKNTYKERLRVASTPNQFKRESLTNHCLGELKKNPSVSIFHHLVKYVGVRRALMLTHIPCDLLSNTNFSILDLLESNTGKIKSKKEFNTKYYPVPREDMSFLPFFEYLLVIFGDDVMFKPESIKLRTKTMNDLKGHNVHPMMSEFSLSLAVK